MRQESSLFPPTLCVVPFFKKTKTNYSPLLKKITCSSNPVSENQAGLMMTSAEPPMMVSTYSAFPTAKDARTTVAFVGPSTRHPPSRFSPALLCTFPNPLWYVFFFWNMLIADLGKAWAGADFHTSLPASISIPSPVPNTNTVCFLPATIKVSMYMYRIYLYPAIYTCVCILLHILLHTRYIYMYIYFLLPVFVKGQKAYLRPIWVKGQNWEAQRKSCRKAPLLLQVPLHSRWPWSQTRELPLCRSKCSKPRLAWHQAILWLVHCLSRLWFKATALNEPPSLQPTFLAEL